MFYYILKLVIMLPIMAGMIYGALWLYRKYQPGLIGRLESDRELKLIETMSMGVSGKLAVVEFGGERLLLSVTRARIDTLASASAPANLKSSAPFPPRLSDEKDQAALNGPAGKGA